jgi:hypothetical protein
VDKYPNVYLLKVCAIDGIRTEEAIAVSADREDLSIALTGWLPYLMPGPPIVGELVLTSSRKLQTHRCIEIQVSGERIQNHGQKGNANIAKHIMMGRIQRAGAEMVVVKSEQLLTNILARTGRLTRGATNASLY